MITVLVALLAFISPEYWLALAYGNAFAGYGFFLRWYAIISILSFLAVPWGSGLRTMEATPLIFHAYLTSTAVSLLLVYPLTAWFGLSGVVFGIFLVNAISHILVFIFFFSEVRRKNAVPFGKF